MVEGSSDEHAIGAHTSTYAVFISYASQDTAVANAVVADLERHGVRCWVAPRDVIPGALYADEIIRSINGVKVFVVVLSASAIASPHVGKEIERASSKRRPIITFRIDAAPLTTALEYFLSESQWVDVGIDGTEAAFGKLITAVKHQLAPTSTAGGAVLPMSGRGPMASVRPGLRWRRPIAAIGTVIIVVGVFLVLDKVWVSKPDVKGKPAIPVPSVPAPNALTIPEKSVAVLPFVDMSEKHDQEYFSDGLSEELIDMLTKVSELRVPARTSSFYFKGKQVKISEIAKELVVAHVLEGSVRKSGNHLRITVQLIRADNGYHLWSETYDRQVDDIFRVQDDIAAAVVKALEVSLRASKAPSATLTTNSEAYELYLQAGSLLHQGTSDDTLRAYADLQQALSLDPKFALAWARLALLLTTDTVDWTRIFKPVASASQSSDADQSLRPSWSDSDIDKDRNWQRSWAQARAAAHTAAQQAINLGPDLSESHRAMSAVLGYVDWNWAAADVELKKARQLEPADARITLQSSILAMTLGRLSEGLELARDAATQDPLGFAWGVMADGQYASGALNEAQLSYQKEIELYPTATGVHSAYALVLLARDEPQAALAEFERESAPQFRDVGRPFALDALGRRSEADSAIALAEQKWGSGMAWNIGQFYASRNDSDRAFYWLERAYRQHDGGLSSLKTDPIYKSLRRDPRYKALLRKVNLPPE